jgi:hypothetical protein
MYPPGPEARALTRVKLVLVNATAAGRRLRDAQTRLDVARDADTRRPSPATVHELECAERAYERAADTYLHTYLRLVNKDVTK